MKWIVVLMALSLGACAHKDHDKKESKMAEKTPAGAFADLKTADNKVKGMVNLEDMPDQIKVTAMFTGLKPNSKHGFHIHENGTCEGPDFKSAGGHLNPSHEMHGGAMAKEHHLGDLGNIEADKNGTAKKEVMISKEGNDEMNKIVGKAFILHAKADDLKSQPSGDAGSRMACGLIKAVY